MCKYSCIYVSTTHLPTLYIHSNDTIILHIASSRRLFGGTRQKHAYIMAGGGSFLHRVVQYVANELIVDKLANNQSFQRFAVRSSRAIEEAVQKGAAKRTELVNQIQAVSENLKEEVMRNLKDPKPPTR